MNCVSRFALFVILFLPLINKGQAVNNPALDSLNERINNAMKQNDVQALIKYNVEKVERFGLDTAGLNRVFTNNMIYQSIFMHSNDKPTLHKGLKWVKIMIDSEPPTPSHIDTYANLLYKLGHKKEALKWEKQALALAPDDGEIKNNIKKMSTGEPTWQTSD